MQYLQAHSAHLVDWLGLLSLCGYIGLYFASPFLKYLVIEKAEGFFARWRSQLRLWWSILFISTIVELFIVGSDMLGASALGVTKMLGVLLFDTHYGAVWLAKMVSIVALGIALTRSRWPTRLGVFSVVLLFAVITFAHSATSHIAVTGMLTIDQVVHQLHIVTIVLWAGSVMTINGTVMPSVTVAAGDGEEVADLLEKSSARLALISAVALFAGIYSAVILLPALSDIWLSEYGRFLLLKIVLVMAMLAVAAAIRSRVLAIGSTRRSDLESLYRIYGLLVWLVLLVATQLAHTSPPTL